MEKGRIQQLIFGASIVMSLDTLKTSCRIPPFFPAQLIQASPHTVTFWLQ